MLMHVRMLAAGLALVAGTAAPTARAADDTAASEKVFAQHLAAFGKGDVEALLADLADDYVFVSPIGIVSGRDGIRPMLAGVVAEFGKPGVVFNVVSQRCTGRVCQLVWNAETPDNSYEYGVDTFVIENGKIAAQTFAARAVPKAK